MEYQLQAGAEADKIIALRVDQVPPEAVPDWITAVRHLMRLAGYELPAICRGPVRIVPEDVGCRVGLDAAPVSKMQWHHTLADGLAHAERIYSEARTHVRARVRDEAEGRARRVVSRMVEEGLVAALTNEMAASHADLQEEIARLQNILKTSEVAGLNLKAHKEADGISVSVVDATNGNKTASELAREAAQLLGPLLLTYLDLHRDIEGRPVAEAARGPETDGEEIPAVEEVIFAAGGFTDGFVDEVLGRLLDDQEELLQFADLELRAVHADGQLALTLDRHEGTHDPPLAAGAVDPNSGVRLRCGHRLELMEPLGAILLAIARGGGPEEEEADPPFRQAFRQTPAHDPHAARDSEENDDGDEF